MSHPKDRAGVSRRQLLRGAARGVVVIGAGGLLAGCENTTTPVRACEGDGSSDLVVPKPVGPGGLAQRQDRRRHRGPPRTIRKRR